MSLPTQCKQRYTVKTGFFSEYQVFACAEKVYCMQYEVPAMESGLSGRNIHTKFLKFLI